MTPEKRLKSVLSFMPSEISSAVLSMDEIRKNVLREIRLRVNRPLAVDIAGEHYYLSREGRLSETEGMKLSREHIESTVNSVFRNSYYSYRRELTTGYMTVSGGCRVGFCGSAVLDEKSGFKVESIKNIGSLNFRITREVIGCAREIFERFGVCSLLIAGPPCSGKTTYLRDLTRIIGSKYNVSLIDERNEIAGAHNGIPSNDIGTMTDVFTSYNKYEAIISAVRSMSPEVIVCDEIGSEEDLRALGYAVNSGVRIIATCHCDDRDDLYQKPVISSLIEMGVFDAAVLLKNGSAERYIELRKELCSS